MPPYCNLAALEPGVLAGFKRDDPALRTSMLVHPPDPKPSFAAEFSIDIFYIYYSSVDMFNNGY